jgi:proline iminopeptidase
MHREIPNLLTVLAVLATVPARAQEPAKPASRAEATAIIANARKIVTPNGVERLENVRIGGIDQWVSIRGADRGNPVLLYMHGGPGYVSMPMSWWFSRGLEEYFTVVQWTNVPPARRISLLILRRSRRPSHANA